MGAEAVAERTIAVGSFPQAAIAVDPPTGDLPLAVRISDVSSGPVVERIWDVGDGTTAQGPELLHTFTTPGRHRIRLTVAGPFPEDPRNVSEAVAEVAIGVFRRGDVRGDDDVDIGDVVLILDFLFAKAAIGCPDAADIDDDGAIDLGDAVGLLAMLFVAPSVPPPPALELGPDPTPDALACPW